MALSNCFSYSFPYFKLEHHPPIQGSVFSCYFSQEWVQHECEYIYMYVNCKNATWHTLLPLCLNEIKQQQKTCTYDTGPIRRLSSSFGGHRGSLYPDQIHAHCLFRSYCRCLVSSFGLCKVYVKHAIRQLCETAIIWIKKVWNVLWYLIYICETKMWYAQHVFFISQQVVYSNHLREMKRVLILNTFKVMIRLSNRIYHMRCCLSKSGAVRLECYIWSYTWYLYRSAPVFNIDTII